MWMWVKIWVWVWVCAGLGLGVGVGGWGQSFDTGESNRSYAAHICFLYSLRSLQGTICFWSVFLRTIFVELPTYKTLPTHCCIMRECVSTCEQILVYPQSRTPSCLARLSFSLFLARACCLSLSHTQSLSPPHPPTPLPPSPLHPSLTFFPQSESPGTNPFLPIFLDQVKRELVPCERHFVSIIVR